MNTNFIIETEPITLQNSPIEFLLVGPQAGQDSILVKSSSAGLDLIGLANYGASKHQNLLNNNSLLSTLTGPYRQLNYIESRESRDLEIDRDPRRSYYRFIWVGNALNKDKREIQSTFNGMLSVMKVMLKGQQTREVELIISNLILECSLANQRWIKNQRLTRAILGIYTLLVVYIAYYFKSKYIR